MTKNETKHDLKSYEYWKKSKSCLRRIWEPIFRNRLQIFECWDWSRFRWKKVYEKHSMLVRLHYSINHKYFAVKNPEYASPMFRPIAVHASLWMYIALLRVKPNNKFQNLSPQLSKCNASLMDALYHYLFFLCFLAGFFTRLNHAFIPSGSWDELIQNGAFASFRNIDSWFTAHCLFVA
jgi:hypothetical protein